MHFAKLRLSGFKSFVDPTELWIETGLTGIVGPNGCGKSNLVDALRWVMGETSAKQLRGGGMDDVIFGGTSNRPARNLAEVSVHLDNGRRTAPGPFNDSDELEVTRRIERGSGSTYLVNGREVRARDVQLLFADAATGAHSTGLVSQGQIGEIIKAKPINRRAILEEAAGITGLHSRRHEAELRLHAAETNLERLDDVLATLEGQLSGLKRQARQASRYRRIGDHIRRAEAIVLHLKFEAATRALEAARARLKEVEARVAERTGRAGEASREQAEAAAALPDLRQAEREAAAALQRLVLEREGLDAEERRLEQARQDCDQRLSHIAADTDRETTLANDAAAALERLADEERTLAAAEEGQEEALAAAAGAVRAVADEVAALEHEMTALTEQVAAEEARRNALERRLAEIGERRARLETRTAEIARERAEAEREGIDGRAVAEAESEMGHTQARRDALRAKAQAAERALDEAQAAEAEAREALQAAEAPHAKLTAELNALSDLLNADEAPDLPPVIDSLTVEPGYEVALGAALGEDLHAPVHASAPVRWESDPPAGEPRPLPEGAESLSRYVEAPPALARRLAQIGVVADDAAGDALRAKLAQGQRLVSRDGALWRWDGFTVAAGAPTPAATRLAQRNRLTEVRAAIGEAEADLARARGRFESAQEHTRERAAALRQAQEAQRAAEAELDAARDTHARLAREAAHHASRLAALEEAAARLEADQGETAEGEREVRAALDELAPAEGRREAVKELRLRLTDARTRLIERERAHDRLQREADARAERLAALADERRSWRERTESAERRLEELEERRRAAESERAVLAQRPHAIAAERSRLMDLIEGAEGTRKEAADRLAEAESRLAAADKRLKQEETQLAEAREDRVRAEAQVEQAMQSRQVVAERILERLGAAPEEALAAGDVKLKDGEALPELEATEAKLDRLLRERDNMGPVNLRAEAEAAEVEEQIATMQSERADLVSAIARLRQGIASLNREGRERLLAAFAQVDTHFQELFVRLFGGGRAHMKLTEADDPLEAGLEIFASPPGKRLQILSLLSGGEQALTALALLFAVFLTNPAPVCVLDEVDAPLDDANVDRFCSLIEEIAHNSDTRFLIVTHHHITMARMDRLFGVTMAERGISQLVSVDLADAERMRATA